jgi:glycosyltransferase involved in cell wall biosynthesis
LKQKILHIIDSFSTGGAEVLLAGVIPELVDFEHVIVYLTPTKTPILSSDPTINIVCLNFRSITDATRIIKELNTIIEQEKPGIIHTHLYFSSLFIRFARTNKINIIQTYHNEYYRIRYPQFSARIKKIGLKLLDRFTMKNAYTVIHVSKAQQLVNDHDVRIKSSAVLYNYVEDQFYQTRKTSSFKGTGKLKIICVGNLKTEKNHILLLHALRQLMHLPIHVTICGEGNDYIMLQKYINRHDLPVTLMGSKKNIHELLGQHDLFVSCSIIEGFGISIAEAMASEIPLIISDISTFKEVTQNKAVFFESRNVTSLAEKIEQFYLSPQSAAASVLACKEIAEQYKKSFYLDRLNTLYKK